MQLPAHNPPVRLRLTAPFAQGGLWCGAQEKRLPCVKGAGTALAVTEGLSGTTDEICTCLHTPHLSWLRHATFRVGTKHLRFTLLAQTQVPAQLLRSLDTSGLELSICAAR